MIQDMAVYHHTKNLHGIPHQDYEAETEGMVRANQSDFSNQLPILSGNQGNQTYTGKPFCTEYILCYADTMECSEEFEHCYDVFPNLPAYNLNLFDAKKLANSVAYYVFDQKRKEIDSHFEPPFVPYFNFNNEAYVKHCLDAAIKASAALIYKFIVDVSQEELPEDRFEPNDSYNMPWRLNPGSYNDLTIDNKEDNDYYLIEMPYRGDLEIRIDYDDKLSGIGAKLERIEMEWANQPYYPTQSSAGKIFKLKGIQKGKYMLHLQSGFIWGAPPNGADLTTTYYDLHITIGGKRLVADWYEDNDSPQTADESLLKYSGNTPGLTIDVEGDDDYYVVRAPVGYRIDIGITFNPSEGNLQLYFNGEKVVPKPLELSKNYSLDPNFMSEKILTLDERV
jgi:hypothetical protein